MDSLARIKQAARSFNKQGIKIVAITMGSKGAVVYNGKEMLLARPPKVIRKSPVGCGDAFIAGFIASHCSNKSFTDCVKMAVACGAANVLSINPGDIEAKKLNKILKQVKLNKL